TRRMRPLVDGGVAFAVVLIRPCLRPHRFVVGHEHAAFARGGDDLVLTERESRSMAKRADRAALVTRADGLRAILDHDERALPSEREQWLHVARPTRQVYGDDGLR